MIPYRTETIVEAYKLGLHFKDGKMIEVLQAGRHIFWGRGHQVMLFDTRIQNLQVQLQEIHTLDLVSVKITAGASISIKDPEKYFLKATSAYEMIYSALQIELRDQVAQYAMQDIVKNRKTIGDSVNDGLAEIAGNLGVIITEVVIRDIVYPGDIKSAIHQEVVAEKIANATLVAARGEVSAARAKANVAQQYAKNPEMLHLEYLKVLDKAASNAGNTFVINGSGDAMMKTINIQ